jgi:hypothetical protein
MARVKVKLAASAMGGKRTLLSGLVVTVATRIFDTRSSEIVDDRDDCASSASDEGSVTR